MKKDRIKLELAITDTITNYPESRRRLKEKLITKLAEHNISAGKAIGLFSLTIPLTTVSNAEIYLFTKALYEITAEGNLLPGSWFNEEEEKSFILYQEKQEYNNDVIILHNVDQVSDKQWICTKATYQEITQIFSQGLITYNIRTQRETTSIVFNNNNIIEVPTIKKDPIGKMTRLMLFNKFTPNTITWNIRRTGEEMLPEYDAKNRTLAIPVDNIKSFCDIIDGMHRSAAMMKTFEENPDTEGFTLISILYYTETEAQEYIDQEAHHTPLDKTHRQSFRNSDSEIIIAKDINSFGNAKNNMLFNKIATNYNEIEHKGKYVTFETFGKAIKYNFKIEIPREISKISKFLKDYFNDILGILQEKNVKFSNNTYIGLISLSSLLYNTDNWQEWIESNIDKIIVVINSLSESDIKNKKITNPFVDKISVKFKEVYKNA